MTGYLPLELLATRLELILFVVITFELFEGGTDSVFSTGFAEIAFELPPLLSLLKASVLQEVNSKVTINRYKIFFIGK